MNLIECVCPSHNTEHEKHCPLFGLEDTKPKQIPAVAAPKKIWPQVPPTHGGLYSFSCPQHGTRMMAMTIETFLEFRQGVDRMQKDLTDAKAANIKLFQETQELQKQLAARPAPGEGPRIITPQRGEIRR